MSTSFPKNFRKLSIHERRSVLSQHLHFSEQDLQAFGSDNDYLELADVMVESAIGMFPIPIGIASGFLIDGEQVNIPMATEEPSVIAAAAHGAKIISAGTGLETWATDPIMTAQLFLANVPEKKEKEMLRFKGEIGAVLDTIIPSMKSRGGGFRNLYVERLPETKLVSVHIDIDVRDAMGANIVNTVAEKIGPKIKDLTGGTILMSILTNTTPKRRSGARFRVPIRFLGYRGMPGKEVAQRIALASHLAHEDAYRAVTHNKGIMNGIDAFVLATGNDTRAVEAAAHHYASIDGKYKSLSRFDVKDDDLEGSIELPMALGTVGGAIGIHPATKLSLKILNNPDARRLCRIAAAIGLAQNLAAIYALVSEGIQHGHMRLHASRIAYMVGARGSEVKELAKRMWDSGIMAAKTAALLLNDIRKEFQGKK